MHKPYTKQAQKVIELTTKAARSMHHNYIGTEHLLLGLLKEGSGVAACVLMDAGNPSGRTDRRFNRSIFGCGSIRPERLFSKDSAYH